MMEAKRLQELRAELSGKEGLAAGCVRAALHEMAGGNLQFGRGLIEAIADLPDTDAGLNAIAKELEEAAR